jgi:predicted NUDIX family NTP pyrophosphohydrolase
MSVQLRRNLQRTGDGSPFEGDCDSATVRSRLFSTEWPKGSGRIQEVPEIDPGALVYVGRNAKEDSAGTTRLF